MDGPYTWGEKKSQGQRTDLEDMRRDIDDGHSLATVAKDHFPVWIKYPSAVKSYQALQAADRTELPTVYVLLGPTRSGKSRLARSMFPGAYWKPNMDYWENYQYEDVIVLDEFYGYKMQYTDLLQLLDSTPLLVNVKVRALFCEWSRPGVGRRRRPANYFPLSRVLLQRSPTRLSSLHPTSIRVIGTNPRFSLDIVAEVTTPLHSRPASMSSLRSSTASLVEASQSSSLTAQLSISSIP